MALNKQQKAFLENFKNTPIKKVATKKQRQAYADIFKKHGATL